MNATNLMLLAFFLVTICLPISSGISKRVVQTKFTNILSDVFLWIAGIGSLGIFFVPYEFESIFPVIGLLFMVIGSWSVIKNVAMGENPLYIKETSVFYKPLIFNFGKELFLLGKAILFVLGIAIVQNF